MGGKSGLTSIQHINPVVISFNADTYIWIETYNLFESLKLVTLLPVLQWLLLMSKEQLRLLHRSFVVSFGILNQIEVYGVLVKPFSYRELFRKEGQRLLLPSHLQSLVQEL